MLINLYDFFSQVVKRRMWIHTKFEFNISFRSEIEKRYFRFVNFDMKIEKKLPPSFTSIKKIYQFFSSTL